jgi:hypothetical protein
MIGDKKRKNVGGEREKKYGVQGDKKFQADFILPRVGYCRVRGSSPSYTPLEICMFTTFTTVHWSITYLVSQSTLNWPVLLG